MKKEEAISVLKHHSFTHDNFENIKSEKGFLGMLRPYNNGLIEGNFFEIMECLKVLQDEFTKDNLNTEIISALWGICHYARMWGIEKEGMLQRNNLISTQETELLSVWIECISYAVANLLEGSNQEAFLEYESYCKDKKR